MDDMTVTQLLARMDAHLAEMDADLARRNAELRLIQENFREQHARMRQTTQMLADTSRFVVETTVEQRAAMDAMTQLLIQMAERLQADRPRRAGEERTG